MKKDNLDIIDELHHDVKFGKLSVEDAANRYFDLYPPSKKWTLEKVKSIVKQWVPSKGKTVITGSDFQKIAKMIRDKDYGYSVIGLRATDKKIRKGQHLVSSWAWEVGTGNRTNRRLNGVSTVSVEHAITGGGWTYGGDKIVLVGGSSYSHGNDAGELIIADPVVLDVFNLE